MKLLLSTVTLAVALGCTRTTPPESTHAPAPSAGDLLRAYVRDPKVGRSALEESLVTRNNTYATLRLARYRAEEWGALPEVDPPTTPIRAVDGPEEAAVWAASPPGDDDAALLALGRAAFFAYPVQIAPAMPRALATPGHGGVWFDQNRFGAVWVHTRGGVQAAYTCATCHASPSAAGLVIGQNNANLDVSAIADDDSDWGPGRVDVTVDGLDNPVAIADLRPMRWQKRMHHAATLRAGIVALAVRIETLVVTSSGETTRPPRRVAAGLALYLLSLGTGTPRSRLVLDQAEREGAVLFERACARCHGGEGAAGTSVPLDVVGTDPWVGRSSERGTGSYRVPSLRNVGDRRRLFASGTATDVTDVLDPARGAAGHPFGRTLEPGERAALLAYLRRL